MPAARAPPASEPQKPISTVSQNGIGSGPGVARRPSEPIRNPEAMTETIALRLMDEVCANYWEKEREDQALLHADGRLAQRRSNDHEARRRALRPIGIRCSPRPVGERRQGCQ